MDFLSNLSLSLQVASVPLNLIFCFIGVLIGTLVGVLPGLGPVATVSLLLPITYKLDAVQAIIMLAGIYYGAQYGGSTTSILLNIPGEASTMITCLDGYQMAKKGRAGAALGISAMGSFIGGTFGIIMMTLIAPPLARMGLAFGPPENASLMIFGLTLIIYLQSGSMVKALMMASLGLLLGFIGTDLITGTIRFNLGLVDLTDGLDIVPVVMGLFGISEVLLNIEGSIERRQFIKAKTSLKHLFPNKQEFKDSTGPIARGSLLGFFLGILPGGGVLLPPIFSYALERKFSKHPEKFGTGYIAGVAGPETANNAGAQGAYIPLMTLGIPPNPMMAILMGAFLIHGITPGPLLMGMHPDLFWGIIGSMYIGNVMLLILNLPLIGLWVKILDVPYVMLFPLIYLFCLIGAYSISNSLFDVIIMIIFGVIGYLMKKFDYPAAPLVLALILGRMLEKNLGQSLMMANGSPMIFFSRTISAILLGLTLFLFVSPLILKWLKGKRPGLIIKERNEGL
jgi:putative tricarboxylic transport membrane protein